MIYSTKTLKMAVMGDPIDHSLSPFLHGAVIEEHGYDALYIPVRVAPEETEDFAKAAVRMGFCGFNATMPHKIRLLQVVDELDEKAALYRSVNTVRIRGGVLTGSNTDVDGLLAALDGRGVQPEGMNVMIIGAGGVAGALTRGFSNRGASSVTVLNRTLPKAEAAAADVRGASAQGLTIENLCKTASRSDLIVNCTPMGMTGVSADFEDLSFLDDTKGFVVDLVYHPWQTSFLKYARERGLRIMNGMPMLICQGLLAFRLFTDIELDLKAEFEYLYPLCKERMTR